MHCHQINYKIQWLNKFITKFVTKHPGGPICPGMTSVVSMTSTSLLITRWMCIVDPSGSDLNGRNLFSGIPADEKKQDGIYLKVWRTRSCPNLYTYQGVYFSNQLTHFSIRKGFRNKRSYNLPQWVKIPEKALVDFLADSTNFSEPHIEFRGSSGS